TEVPTGQTKGGAVIGDHAKTGLGVLLDCGTVIGPFARVMPCGGLWPRAGPARHHAGSRRPAVRAGLARLLGAGDPSGRPQGADPGTGGVLSKCGRSPGDGYGSRVAAAPHRLKYQCECE